MNKRLPLMFVMIMVCMTATQAKVKLHHLVGDNMILQQQTEARLWGWDDKGKEVKVSVSWSKDVYRTKADNDGRWEVFVKTPKASYTPLSITFDDGEKTTINNVLAGEVWVCAGQSNMQMTVKGFGSCPIEGYTEEVVNANQYKAIHYVKIPETMRMTPQEDAKCEWKEVGTKTVAKASAVGYFFAQVVSKVMDVPVGLIMANKGGTRVESWLTKENLEKYTEEPTDSDGIVKFKPKSNSHRAMLWGNGTFNPILKYTVKGIVFYQGCSNVGDPDGQYSERLKLLVEQWRSQFQCGEIPFYFVEIAPYYYDNADADQGARLREQQYRASQIIPNSGLVSTNDLVYPYEKKQIHPAKKKPVGQRLAYMALNKTYGYDEIGCVGPSFKDMRIVGDTVDIHLDNDFGAISRLEDIEGFELAGEDKVFYPAKAEYYKKRGSGYWGEAIRITSPDVRQPVAVRYCFKNFQIGNLKNAVGLPLYPFRTDKW